MIQSILNGQNQVPSYIFLVRERQFNWL